MARKKNSNIFVNDLKNKNFWLIVLLVVALPVTIFLIQQQQIYKQDAYLTTSQFLISAKTGRICGGSIEVTWRKSTVNDSKGYWLYRSPVSGFSPSLANKIAGPIYYKEGTPYIVYTDQRLTAGRKYYYKMIVSGTQGNITSNQTYAMSSYPCTGTTTTPAPTLRTATPTRPPYYYPTLPPQNTPYPTTTPQRTPTPHVVY